MNGFSRGDEAVYPAQHPHKKHHHHHHHGHHHHHHGGHHYQEVVNIPGQIGPGVPVAPIAPIAPVAPVAPIAPAAPIAPVFPGHPGQCHGHHAHHAQHHGHHAHGGHKAGCGCGHHAPQVTGHEAFGFEKIQEANLQAPVFQHEGYQGQQEFGQVSRIVEPTVHCHNEFDHYNKVEHIVPVIVTNVHHHHTQHDWIIVKEAENNENCVYDYGLECEKDVCEVAASCHKEQRWF